MARRKQLKGGIKEEFFAAVRRNGEGHEWVDFTTASHTQQRAEQYAGRVAWAKDKPAVRIGKFLFTEVENGLAR